MGKHRKKDNYRHPEHYWPDKIASAPFSLNMYVGRTGKAPGEIGKAVGILNAEHLCSRRRGGCRPNPQVSIDEPPDQVQVLFFHFEIIIMTNPV